MHPAPVSFMPAYNYQSGSGLTLYHHDHYVHYSVMDMILRTVLVIILFTMLFCMLCYLITLCPQSEEEIIIEEYEADMEQENLIVEEKVEFIQNADGSITENKTVI